MTLEELSAQLSSQFNQIYGRPPRWIAGAPGAVNVIGEHTDYNDGFVFPMAIDRYTVIAAAPPTNGGNKIQLSSTVDKKPVAIELSQPLKPPPKGPWFNYPL